MDFAYDFLAPVSVIKKIIPAMMERNTGHIINLSSLDSLMPAIGRLDILINYLDISVAN